MSKKPITDKHGNVRALSASEIAAFRPAVEVLPPDLLAVLPKRKPGQRGKQKAPTKQSVYLRLDQEVVHYFKSTGAGWQTRLNSFLKSAVTNLPVNHG
jgi:uncharacterized protein (DUF4415 family)